MLASLAILAWANLLIGMPATESTQLYGVDRARFGNDGIVYGDMVHTD